MANENMIKFYRGLVDNLPSVGANGALYITTDEGAIYYGTGTGMKRLGDFIQVNSVSDLPTDGANTSALYYCNNENILAKYDSTKGWQQINKQPSVEDLKVNLGLGSMAYKSEVAEGDLNADLKAKVNAAAEGNHSHANKTVLDGITAEKVAAWDASEKNAKDYADGLNTAMNTRVEALEAVDHEHANKELLDTYTQTEANLADAVAKKHSHTFNETELNKIVEGDVAKWNGVAADHLTSADKTTLENAIKEAKKAGTDANTNIETYKVSNDARVKAVEDDIAEITDATNGVLAQAKSYSDGKLATARTEISAEIDADVKVVADELAGYKTSNDAALAGVKATAEAAATKVYTDAELAKKVDKVEGKSLVSDTEITKLAGVSAGANKVEASETNGKIKIDGVETTVYTHPEKHAIADVDGLQAALDGMQAAGDYAAEEHTHTKSEITDFAHTHTVSEITDFEEKVKAYDYATKTEAQGYADAKDEAIAAAKKAGDDAQADVNDLVAYVGEFTATEGVDTVVKYIDAKTAGIASDEALTALAGRVEQAEKDIDAIEADYLKAADKTELEGKIALKADTTALEAEAKRAGEAEGALAGRLDTAEGTITIHGQQLANLGEAVMTMYGIDGENLGDSGKSIRTIANEELAAQLIGENAKESLDTLQEIAAWIQSHPDDASAMNEAIEALQAKVDTGDKTVSAYVADAITAIKIGDYALAADLTELAGRVTALETESAKHVQKTEFEEYKTAHAGEYTNAQIDAAIKVNTDAIAANAEAIAAAKTEASNQDAVILAEAQAYADQAEADAIAAAEGKVKALAEGAVADNTADIADIMEMLTWGSF